jgi:hypothetical protein
LDAARSAVACAVVEAGSKGSHATPHSRHSGSQQQTAFTPVCLHSARAQITIHGNDVSYLHNTAADMHCSTAGTHRGAAALAQRRTVLHHTCTGPAGTMQQQAGAQLLEQLCQALGPGSPVLPAPPPCSHGDTTPPQDTAVRTHCTHATSLALTTSTPLHLTPGCHTNTTPPPHPTPTQAQPPFPTFQPDQWRTAPRHPPPFNLQHQASQVPAPISAPTYHQLSTTPPTQQLAPSPLLHPTPS